MRMLLMILLAGQLFAAKVLPLVETEQQKDQWCWAGCSYTILNYYGETPSQGEIVTYAYGDSAINQWNWLYGNGAVDYQGVTYNPHGINQILDNWNTPNQYGNYSLSEESWKSEIDNGNPFVIRWGWNSGGGHFVVGQGYLDNGMYQIMNPWFGDGYTINTYDWIMTAQGGQGNWTHSLTTDRTPSTETLYQFYVTNGSGSGAYGKDSVVSVSATIPTGKEFVKWSGGDTYIADSLSAVTTVTMPGFNFEITALFQDKMYLELLSPSTETTVVIGSELTVTWGGNLVDDSVVVELRNNVSNKKLGTLSSTDTLLVSVLDSTIDTGSYRVYISNKTGEYVDSSAVIHLSEPVATEFEVVVENGSGDGFYSEGDTVTIIADSAPTGSIFDTWAGTAVTALFTNDSVAQFIMGTSSVTFTANYKVVIEVDTSNLSENLVPIGTWESFRDTLGSTASFDSLLLSENELSASLMTVSDDEINSLWAWSQVTVSLPGDMKNSDALVLRYSADSPINLVLDQDGLSENGVAFGCVLPASSDTVVVLTPDMFEQPDYTDDSLKTELDVTTVGSLSFEVTERDKEVSFTINSLKLNNYEVETTALNRDISTSVRGVVVRNNTIAVHGLGEGNQTISLFSLAGRELFRTAVTAQTAQAGIALPAVGRGIFILNVNSASGAIRQKIAIQ